MITLSTIPAVVLARDPLPITFLSDNYKQSWGYISTRSFVFITMPGTDDRLTVSYTSGAFQFVCKAVPDDSGLQFRTPNVGESLITYMKRAIVPALNSYFLFRQLFVAEYDDGNYIRIETNTKKYETIIVSTTGFSFTGITSHTGSPDVYRQNFKINYQLYDYTTNLPVSASESLEPNADGRLIVNISELVQGFAKSSFDFETTDFAVLLPNDTFKFYLKYWESYGIGDAFTNRKSTNSGAFTAIDGATSWIEQAKLNEEGKMWYNGLVKTPWLTRKPITSTILPDQTILLKFLVLFVGPFQFIGTIRATSSTGAVTVINRSIFSVDVNQIVQINVSPKFLGLADNIVKMEVYLYPSIGGAYLTDVLTFNIDRNYYNNIRHFLFRNSLGGFDTLQSLGLGSVKESYDRIRSTTQLTAQHTRKDRETKVLSVTQETLFKVNLGFSNNWGESNQAWANYIRQLYSTHEAYEIIQGYLYPIDIITGDQKLLEDENYLPDFLELEYTRAYVEKGATSEIPALQGSYTNQYSESYD